MIGWTSNNGIYVETLVRRCHAGLCHGVRPLGWWDDLRQPARDLKLASAALCRNGRTLQLFGHEGYVNPVKPIGTSKFC